MNTTGFRACVKEIYVTRYDPLSVSYAVVIGQSILDRYYIDIIQYEMYLKVHSNNKRWMVFLSRVCNK